MIGTKLIEEFVQSIALTHKVKGYSRVSALLLADPESGKTTITTATKCTHVTPIAIMTGRSVLKEVNENPHTEFLLFNDLTAIKAMSTPASNLLVVFLNQLTQDERGKVGFAGKENDEIKRPVGIIGCIPFKTFKDRRARWLELGFMSRMIPFAYKYDLELVMRIKDSIDNGTHSKLKSATDKMPKVKIKQMEIDTVDQKLNREIRYLADSRAVKLGEIGIRLLSNYHCLVRAHALLDGRRKVSVDDLDFLRAVDQHVRIDACTVLVPESISRKKFKHK